MRKLPAKESATGGPAPAAATRETLRHRRDHGRWRRELVAGQAIAGKASELRAVVLRRDSKAARNQDPTFIDEGHGGQGKEEGRRGAWAMINFQTRTQPGTSALELSKSLGPRSMSSQSIVSPKDLLGPHDFKGIPISHREPQGSPWSPRDTD